MPVTPDSILESAAAMSEGDAEVDWRNATSRAYYAAYHRCRPLATVRDPHADLSTRESHRVVYDILVEGEGSLWPGVSWWCRHRAGPATGFSPQSTGS